MLYPLSHRDDPEQSPGSSQNNKENGVEVQQDTEEDLSHIENPVLGQNERAIDVGDSESDQANHQGY